jgi:hypothetical protein
MEGKKNTGINEIEVALVDTIAADNLNEVLGSIAESISDTMLSSGVLQNLPVFDIIYKMGQMFRSIQDQIFAKNVLKFVLGIKGITVEEGQKFVRELEEKTGQKAGETLVILLARLDNVEKPQILANLLKAKVKGCLSIEKFLRLASIVDKAFLPDLKKLSSFEAPAGRYEENVTETLNGLGLVYQVAGQVGMNDINYGLSNNNKFKISPLGLDMLNYGIGRNGKFAYTT